MSLKITTLIEDNQDDSRQLYYEHGLSLLIESDGKRILFDTGQSGDYIKNASVLNVNLDNLDAVILSHSHYDHSGGFEKFVNQTLKIPQLIVGEEFFRLKYKMVPEGKFEYNGASFNEEYIGKNNIKLIKVSEKTIKLSDNIMIFHHFSKNADFEKRNSRFYIREGADYIPDEFDDEISLGIITDKGLVVIVGCSHVGIINILNSISGEVNTPIYAVIGGTHLIDADNTRIERTIDALKEIGIGLIAVSHCTGEEGIQTIRKSFCEKFIFNNTGNTINI